MFFKSFRTLFGQLFSSSVFFLSSNKIFLVKKIWYWKLREPLSRKSFETFSVLFHFSFSLWSSNVELAKQIFFLLPLTLCLRPWMNQLASFFFVLAKAFFPVVHIWRTLRGWCNNIQLTSSADFHRHFVLLNHNNFFFYFQITSLKNLFVISRSIIINKTNARKPEK